MARQMVCQSCGVVTVPKKETKGSIFIEIVLWLIFFPVGIIYSIWRLCSKVKVCRACGNENCFVPQNSPVGKQFLANQKSTNIDLASQIEKLAELKDRGHISEEEFNKKKTELLS